MKRKITWLILPGLIVINAIAYLHAYRFTHFSLSDDDARTKDPKELSTMGKLKVLFAGIDNPKPQHIQIPERPFKTLHIKSDVTLEAWYIPAESARGTIVLFHGYAGEKSALLSRAEEFYKLGYHTLLVDFMGSGGSEGNSTSIGFTESREVKDAFDYVEAQGEKNIHLFGTSMGAAAVLKAIHDDQFEPSSIILECPFGSLQKTVSARFNMMGVPSFPMSYLLTFWGGAQHGYWAFAHNPQEYALDVKCPTLILFGEKDNRVSMEETETLFNNLGGQKTLATYPDEGHALFTETNQSNWIRDVSKFLESIDPQ
ncbi:MAG TPA: alpha/beta fold hydrolase [Ohtaekwangia sp.]|nr:alpha/beta fold hydrolase [Ohtaekwangia sp.]